MKVFSPKDLDGSPNLILKACETEGVAFVRAQNGALYEIRPSTAPSKSPRSNWLEDHKGWLRTSKTIHASNPMLEAVDALVAG